MKHSILITIALSLLGALFLTGISFLNDALAQAVQPSPLPSQQVSATHDSRPEQASRMPEVREDGSQAAPLNASPTQNVDLIGQIDFDYVDPIYSVAVQGDYAYAGGYRLAILNVADSAHPTLVGQTHALSNYWYAHKVVVFGTYAYTANLYDGLHIIDVSSPLSPTEIGSYYTSGYVENVILSGTYAYVTDGSALHIVDVSDPARPTETGFYVVEDYVWINDIAVSGSYAYIADNYGLQILDVSNPTTPTQVSEIRPVDASFYQGGGLLGDYAYVVAISSSYQKTLRIFDISNPFSPTEVVSYPVPGLLEHTAGSRAYFSSDDFRLCIWDISNPLSPIEISSYPMHYYPEGVAVSGTHVYVSECMSGLRILDVSDPTQPIAVGYYAMLAPRSIAASGTRAYIAAEWTGLHIFDVADPAKPAEIGFHALPEGTFSVAVSGTYAYASGQSGLRIFDMSDPSSPTQVGSVDTLNVRDIAVSGPYIYITTGDKLHIIDVSNPASPAQLGSFSPAIGGGTLAVSGSYVYYVTLDYPGELDIVDVSDPTSPTLVSRLGVGYYNSGVAVSGSYVYISGGWYLNIVDVSNPASPSLTASYSVPWASGVTVSGVYAYVAQDNSLYVIDVSNPANPSAVGLYNAPWMISDMAAPGPYMYIIGNNGLAILRFNPPPISGRVLDHDGNPMPGVQIAASSGVTLTTDASGRYTLTNLLAGTYVFTPVTPGYLWVPPSHSITLSLDMPEPSFVGHAALKQASSNTVMYGDVVTYTLHVAAPSVRSVALYDRLPEYTTYLGASLVAPAGVEYDPIHNAISGTLSLTAGLPLSVSYAVRVGQDGSVGSVPLVTNTAALAGLANGRTLSATAVVNVSFPTLGEWRIETVTDIGGVNGNHVLALDDFNRPHISYYYSEDLNYAWHDGSAWYTETVDKGGERTYVWKCTSLALDGSGRPHISYLDGNPNYDLKYAQREAAAAETAGHAGSTWRIEIVASTGLVGQSNSLALDGLGQPHLSYWSDWGDYPPGLKYAWHDGSTWHTESVDSEPWYNDEGEYNSLALDGTGRPHISYSNDGLKYAQREVAGHDGSIWHIETVDSAWGIEYNSLALDGMEQPHISYTTGYPNHDLKYARREAAGRETAGHAGNAWHVETVDSEVSSAPSLALDDSGRPHISYRGDYPYHDIRHAWHDGNTWHIETVYSSEEGVGQITSLALDDSGQPHILYWDEGLKYAWYEPFLLLDMQVIPGSDVYNHQLLTYTLVLSGAGANARLWNPLPDSLRYVTDSLTSNLATPAVYSPSAHAITWRGALPSSIPTGTLGLIRFQAVVDIPDGGSPFEMPTITNTAWLTDTDYGRAISATTKLKVRFPPLRLDKQAAPVDGVLNRDVVTYTLALSGTGQNATLWDPLPMGVYYVSGSLTSTLSPPAVYSPTARAITWQGILPGSMPTDTLGLIRFQATRGITTAGSLNLSLPIVNTAWLTDTENGTYVRATAIVNGYRLYMPFVMREK
ncbi:MAG: carboxypeptidase regulatory-like domain-containing protein [Thermoflexales bacterium]|nr:carboxypeptidase regulatory-like domain-containing protein [Thermoflexales bacterium]